MPKPTEHFLADLHGEYEAFQHVLRNASGNIKRKVKEIFGNTLREKEIRDLCTLIYYPKQKLELVKQNDTDLSDYYQTTLNQLIAVCRNVSSKYTRSKVRKSLPPEFAYIIEELLHESSDDRNKQAYVGVIIQTIIGTGRAAGFVKAICELIQRLAIDQLHILGDIFDRGPGAHLVMDTLSKYHHWDIQWGNHDILWMGAACGSQACIASVVRNCLSYNNISVLEQGYGISLRPLVLFAEKMYPEEDPNKAARKAISIILFKLEGQIIRRNPDYGMEDRLLLDKVDFDNATIELDGTVYELSEKEWPTINRNDPYSLDPMEREIMDELEQLFRESEQLQRHITFLYNRGSIYRCFNGNLLFHGCVPLDEDGSLKALCFDGRVYQGKSYMDYADSVARRAFFNKNCAQKYRDFMWYLWCGSNSPLSGRVVKTFERTFIEDKSTWVEPQNPYYHYHSSEQSCRMVLREFGLYGEESHIINGHTPIHVKQGENPLKANGRLIVIDGGFCKAYQKTTGIAGYTLIYNSHGMRLKSHQPFSGMEAALEDNLDIDSDSQQVATFARRMMVADTETGTSIKEQIADLEDLLTAYREGLLPSRV